MNEIRVKYFVFKCTNAELFDFVFYGDLVELITLIWGLDTAKFTGLKYMLFVVFV